MPLVADACAPPRGQVKNWKVLDTLRERVEAIKKLMPLIMDLRNPAMRDRHWRSLMDEVGKQFDPHADTFTLEVVLDLGFEHHQETISSQSAAAGKELAIEEAIIKIEQQWDALPLDLADYKGDYLKLRTVDDLYSALEDNAVGISTMKASRFAASFLGELDTWEKSLSQISETVEMMMGVQRKWMYLESIFVGSEDIRKQLPAESAMFDEVNTAWIKTTKEMQAEGTAYKACKIPGVLERLVSMDDKLDKIQKVTAGGAPICACPHPPTRPLCTYFRPIPSVLLRHTLHGPTVLYGRDAWAPLCTTVAR